MESVTVVDDNCMSLLDSQNYSKILRKGLHDTVCLCMHLIFRHFGNFENTISPSAVMSAMYIISHKCVVDINYLLILLYSIYASSKFVAKCWYLNLSRKCL